jgi:hypothetical protein
MLKPAWYLPESDWFALLADAPRLNGHGQAVIGQLADILRDEGPFDPAVTVVATHTILLAVQHLGDTMTYAAARHELTEVGRLLCGLNLALAHVAQILQRIASNVDTRAYPGAAETPAEALQSVTESLSTAGANSELLAGHLKEAHLHLRSLLQ